MKKPNTDVDVDKDKIKEIKQVLDENSSVNKEFYEFMEKCEDALKVCEEILKEAKQYE